MANGRYSQSRSPIRAIAAASHTAAGMPLPQTRTWGDAPPARVAHGHIHDLETIEELRHRSLACPECGTALSLQLGAAQAGQPVAPSIVPTTSQIPLDQFEDAVNAFRGELITRALEENGGVMTRAAKALGLKYTTFVAMAHRLGVSKNGDRSGQPGDFRA